MKEAATKTERRGVGKRLTDGQRVEIIKLFESGAAVTEADVARRYGVTRSAIWRLRRASSQIMERYQEGDIESRDDRRRGPSLASSSATSVGAAAGVGESAPVVAVDAAEGRLAAAMSDPTALQALGLSLTRPITGELSGNAATNADSSEARTGVMSSADVSVQPAQSVDRAAVRETPTTPVAETTQPLVYLSVKAIGTAQSPGILNWERVSGAHDDEFFEIVNDGLSVRSEGTYQINVDLQHSQPRQNFRFAFKVWRDKKLLGLCSCPLRTSKEVALSVLELRCSLPALAKISVEFLAPGFAFHESRVTIRLLP